MTGGQENVWLRRVALLAALLLGMAAWDRPARACSGANTVVASRGFSPPAGSIGVPTNARLTVIYQSFRGAFGAFPGLFPSPGSDIQIRVAGGPPQEATFTIESEFSRILVDVTPVAGLLPNTEYELLDRRTVPCNDGAACSSLGDPTVIATFTTGAGPDETAPVFGGLTGITETRQTCDDDGCCGPFDGVLWTLNWNAGLDESSGDVNYKVYSATTLLKRFVPPGVQAFGTCSGNVNADMGWIRGSSGPFLVRAFDWAGNEDGNTVAVSPPGPTCGATTGAPAAGCACAMGSTSPELAHLGFFLAIALGILSAGWRPPRGRRSLRSVGLSRRGSTSGK